jgi:D-sedoheptulose 7-phosphate isomerase
VISRGVVVDAQLRPELKERVRAALREGLDLRRQLLETGVDDVTSAADRVVRSLRSGGKLLLCGNGGSAADCQHIAAELTGRFSGRARAALAAISLTTDTSALSAIANDFGYDQVFARQVEALGKAGDVLLAISTSGKSPNVLRAAERARALAIEVIALTGPTAGPLGALADQIVAVPGATTDRIQELHITVGHILCDLIEHSLSG